MTIWNIKDSLLLEGAKLFQEELKKLDQFKNVQFFEWKECLSPDCTLTLIIIFKGKKWLLKFGNKHHNAIIHFTLPPLSTTRKMSPLDKENCHLARKALLKDTLNQMKKLDNQHD